MTATVRWRQCAAVGVAMVVGLLAGPVQAQFQDELQVDKVEVTGSDDSLFNDDRFETGTSPGDEGRLTNLADCEAYNAEEPDGDRCSVSAEGILVTVEFSQTASSELFSRYSVKLGTSCGSSLSDTDENCEILIGPTEYNGSGEFTVELARLIGTLDENQSEFDGDTRLCCSDLVGQSGQVDVTVYIGTDDNDTDNVETASISFDYDYARLSAPSDVVVTGNGETVGVEWTKLSNVEEEDVDYRVYYSQTVFTQDDLPVSEEDSAATGVSSQNEPGTSNSTTLESLVPNSTYYVGLVAIDTSDNVGILTEVFEVVTVETADGWEAYQDAGGSDPGGFCFIATAAWGSYLDPHVETLRLFRDQALLTHEPGRAFVDFYYTHGPAWAAFIADRPALRAAVRVALLPLVAYAWFVLELGWMGKLSFLLGLWLLVAFSRHVARRVFWVPTLKEGPLA